MYILQQKHQSKSQQGELVEDEQRMWYVYGQSLCGKQNGYDIFMVCVGILIFISLVYRDQFWDLQTHILFKSLKIGDTISWRGNLHLLVLQSVPSSKVN